MCYSESEEIIKYHLEWIMRDKANKKKKAKKIEEIFYANGKPKKKSKPEANRLKVLLKLNQLFRRHINAICVMYKYDMGVETSPRWIQLIEISELSKCLIFRNSQDYNSKFKIYYGSLPQEDQEVIEGAMFLDIYDYFKKLKYHLIDKNFPTIKEGGTQ